MDLGLWFLGLLTNELLLVPPWPCSALLSLSVRGWSELLDSSGSDSQTYNFAVGGKI